MRSGTIQTDLTCPASVKRHSIALFLSTLVLAGGTVACGQTPEAGEQGGEEERQPLTSPGNPAQGSPGESEGGEGGEGDEGGEGGEGGDIREGGED
jgi:hypothetical protein